MKYAGLFVGVDRQQDGQFEALAYAGRDAAAMWAFFADANEAERLAGDQHTQLLVGDHATRANVSKALAELRQLLDHTHYDCVVLHFACHGTPGATMILADTRFNDVRNTGLTSSDILLALEGAEAGTIIAIFEHCHAGDAARGSEEDDAALNAFLNGFGTGNRAVIFGTGGSQKAWETPQLKHGLLTHALVIEGLYGTHADRDGAISLERWIVHGAEMAQEHAELAGLQQTPLRRIAFDASASIPKYPIGTRRSRQLAADAIHEVEPDLRGVEKYEFPSSWIDAVRSRLRHRPLNALQVKAIHPNGVLVGRNVIVSGPTSSGKTLVGELAALATASRRGRTACLVPMRAIAAEQHQAFHTFYSACGLRAVRSYGDASDQDGAILAGHFDVAFLTYEKFWLLSLLHPHFVEGLDLVVVDEVHMLGDSGRGRTVELILTMLRERARRDRPVQVLGLSAALNDPHGVNKWLNGALARESERPVPLLEGVVGPRTEFRFRDSRTPSEVKSVRLLNRALTVPVFTRDTGGVKARGWIACHVVRELVRRHDRVLIFRGSKWATMDLAGHLSNELGLERCDGLLRALGSSDARNDHSTASRKLHQCLKRGVGFHTTELDRNEREALEESFRSGELRVLVATSGLAMGVNLPANAVVIVDVHRGKIPFSVAEYTNMAGRAGRWIDGIQSGTSVLIAQNDLVLEELWQRYVLGTPEPLVSQLVTEDADTGRVAAGWSAEDLILALLAMSIHPLTPDELLALVGETFGGYSHRSDDVWRGDVRDRLQVALAQLAADEFVIVGENVVLMPVGSVCGTTSLTAESARRVRGALRELARAEESISKLTLLGVAQLTVELDALSTPTEDVSTDDGKRELQAWHEGSQLTLGKAAILFAALASHGATKQLYLQRLKRLNSLYLWVEGKSLSDIEDAFSLHAPAWKKQNPSAGAVREAARRTADLLYSVTALAMIEFPKMKNQLLDMAMDLSPRLEHGISTHATKLVRLGLGIPRHAALRLSAKGLTDPDMLMAAIDAGDSDVADIFHPDQLARVRLRLREQIGNRRARDATALQDAAQRSLFERIGDATML